MHNIFTCIQHVCVCVCVCVCIYFYNYKFSNPLIAAMFVYICTAHAPFSLITSFFVSKSVVI